MKNVPWTIAIVASGAAIWSVTLLTVIIIPVSHGAARTNAPSRRAARLAASLAVRPVARGSRRLESAQAVNRQAMLPLVDHVDIAVKHRLLADSALRALPAACRDHVVNFYVTYGPLERRGFGGATSIIVTGNVPDSEFRALIAHECGHVIDLGAMQGTESTGQTAFFDGNEPVFADDLSLGFYQLSWETATKQRSDSQLQNFVSGYAQTDAFEDFAETFAFYALQQAEFQRLSQANTALNAKFTWMRDHVFAGMPPIAQGSYRRSGSNPPWDVTKLPYEWTE